MLLVPPDCPSANPSRRHLLVGQALNYFSRHFHRPIVMGGVAEALGVTEACLEFCFDQFRGMTPFEALQHHRLNQLFASIMARPQQGLASAIHACGLVNTAATDAMFEGAFGIAMPLFQQACHQAAADRKMRKYYPVSAIWNSGSCLQVGN